MRAGAWRTSAEPHCAPASPTRRCSRRISAAAWGSPAVVDSNGRVIVNAATPSVRESSRRRPNSTRRFVCRDVGVRSESRPARALPRVHGLDSSRVRHVGEDSRPTVGGGNGVPPPPKCVHDPSAHWRELTPVSLAISYARERKYVASTRPDETRLLHGVAHGCFREDDQLRGRVRASSVCAMRSSMRHCTWPVPRYAVATTATVAPGGSMSLATVVGSAARRLSLDDAVASVDASGTVLPLRWTTRVTAASDGSLRVVVIPVVVQP